MGAQLMRRLPPKTALVTGAASGIGRELARECARRNIHLLLVDLNEKGLNDTAEIIRAESTVEITLFTQDLSAPDAADKCLAFCDEHNLSIDLLINNAGIFFFAPLLDAPTEKVKCMCDLHIYTVTRMCMLFGARMKQRNFGYILNISSMSAWMAMPGINVYNASKSYIRSLSRSLYFELKPHSVCVTAVCPGGINTTLFGLPENLRKLALRLHILMTPQKLAEKSIAATLKGKKQTIPGWLNHLFVFFILIIPDWLVFFLMRKLAVYKKFNP